MTTLLGFLALGAVAFIAAVLLRSRRVRLGERRALLRNCGAVLDEAVFGVDPSGFQTLCGSVQGHQIEVSLVCDTLAFRRLPQLWLRLVVRVRTGSGSSLGVARRSTNVEFYSATAMLPQRHAVPAPWPQDTVVRGTPGSSFLVERCRDLLAPLLSDERIKDVLVTPQRIRVVRQTAQGKRGPYLLFRDSRFAMSTVAPEELSGLVQAALLLARDLGRNSHSELLTLEAAHANA
jgi:hypothetical protein